MTFLPRRESQRQLAAVATGFVASVMAMLLLFACGGGGSRPSTPVQPPTTQQPPVLTGTADEKADQLIALMTLDEKLQIGTADGFVKIAVSLDQPNIDAVLRERTALLVKHAEELREHSRLIHGSYSNPGAPVGRASSMS